MATLKQKRAIDKLVGNGGNITRAMIEAGYSAATANTPQKLTESVGYKEALRELGLTEGLVTNALVYDIQQKPKNRVPELRLASEILNMTDREKSGDKTLILVVSGESAKRFDVRPK